MAHVDVAQVVVMALAAQSNAPTAMAWTLLGDPPVQANGTATTINGAMPEMGSIIAAAVVGLVGSMRRAGALQQEGQ